MLDNKTIIESLYRHLDMNEDYELLDIVSDNIEENVRTYFKNKIQIIKWNKYIKLANPSNLLISIDSSIECQTIIDAHIYDNYAKCELSIELTGDLSTLHDIRKSLQIRFNSPIELRNKLTKEISSWIISNWERIPNTSKLIKMTNDNRLNSTDKLKIEQAKKGKNFIKISSYEINKAVKGCVSATAIRAILEPFIEGINLLEYNKYLNKVGTPAIILAIVKDYVLDAIRYVKENIDDYSLEFGQLNKNTVYKYYEYMNNEEDVAGDGPAYNLLEYEIDYMFSNFSNLADNDVYNIVKAIEKSLFIDKLKRTWDNITLKKKLFQELYK